METKGEKGGGRVVEEWWLEREEGRVSGSEGRVGGSEGREEPATN